MNRSFTLTVLTLIALEVGTITLAFYSSQSFFRGTPANQMTAASLMQDSHVRRGPEVVVLWTPRDESAASQYQVIRHDLTNENSATVIATVGGGTMSQDGGYFRVRDTEGNNGTYAYEVISVSNSETPQVVTSVALLI